MYNTYRNTIFVKKGGKSILEVRHKIKLILNDTLKKYFDRCFGYDRYCWNMMLLMKKLNPELRIEKEILTCFKKTRQDWEWELPSTIPTQVSRDLARTYKRYKGELNYKTKSNPKQSFYVRNDVFAEGSWERIGKHMKLCIGFGKACKVPDEKRWMLLTEDPAYYGRSDYKLLSTTILKEYNEYYISFCIQINGREPTQGTGQVGIDPGVKKVMTLSDGTEYNFPKKKLERLETKAKFYQAQMSRREIKGKEAQSNRYLKAKHKHQVTLRKMNAIKRDWMHKVTTEIVRKNKFIAWENCKASVFMKNHHIAKSIAMSCWFTISQMLKYKCEHHGATFIPVDPRKGATQACSHCGHKFKGKDRIKLSERRYVCPECGLEMDRDLNAAKNILNFALNLARA